MNLLTLDHLALSCEALDLGTSTVAKAFGVAPSPGGEHPAMGTHNTLLSLGPEIYFEIIAINPEADGPRRPRWFNIDNFEGPPRLTNWIVQTPDLEAALAKLPKGFGVPMSLQRGDLRWRMAVPDSGILPFGGWAPALIEWQSDLHPARKLPEHNIRLKSLQLCHPDAEEMAALLAPLMPRDTAVFHPSQTPELRAWFDTPTGEVIVS